MKPATIWSELRKRDFRVTIFGSSRMKSTDPEYTQVYNLAKLIGERGIDLVTGGGPGIMEAASAGHNMGKGKTKAHTIGLNIKLPHEQRINDYVDIKKEFTRFSERLDNFMLLSNSIVVAHGGIGTILELLYAWQLMQVKHICNIPIILLGPQWKGLIKWLKKEPLKRGFFSKEDLQLLFIAKNSKEAMKIIEESYKEYKKGNKNFCLNYKKYKIK
ncbi:MAG: LOG family protein [Nanoarchaeota archaeon]|nr:LOG family protein [Nanoarchaeota archaeon]